MNVDKMRHQTERAHVAQERRAAARVVAFIRKHILRPDEPMQDWQATYLSAVIPKMPPLNFTLPRGRYPW